MSVIKRFGFGVGVGIVVSTLGLSAWDWKFWFTILFINALHQLIPPFGYVREVRQ